MLFAEYDWATTVSIGAVAVTAVTGLARVAMFVIGRLFETNGSALQWIQAAQEALVELVEEQRAVKSALNRCGTAQQAWLNQQIKEGTSDGASAENATP